MSLPAADDLFRPTTSADAEPASATPAASRSVIPADDSASEGKPSRRVRHDEKMTIYVTADELFEIEQARLILRRTHGQVVDRGRLVREAVAIALADLDQNGEDSVLVQRLIEP